MRVCMKQDQSDSLQGLRCRAGIGEDFLALEMMECKPWPLWPESSESQSQEEVSQEENKIKRFEKDPRMHLTLSTYRPSYPPRRTQNNVIDNVAGATGEWMLLKYNTSFRGRESSLGSDFPWGRHFPAPAIYVETCNWFGQRGWGWDKCVTTETTQLTAMSSGSWLLCPLLPFIF